MRTNVDIDETLINECVKLTGIRTKKNIIDLAMRHLVKSLKRKEILELEGRLPWEGSIRKMRQDRV